MSCHLTSYCIVIVFSIRSSIIIYPHTFTTSLQIYSNNALPYLTLCCYLPYSSLDLHDDVFIYYNTLSRWKWHKVIVSS